MNDFRRQFIGQAENLDDIDSVILEILGHAQSMALDDGKTAIAAIISQAIVQCIAVTYSHPPQNEP
jgi:hypothetical protein